MPAQRVGAVIVATVTNPQPLPTVAAQVAAALGLGVPAFDINVACASFRYALHLAHSLIEAGTVATVLVIGVDRMLDLVDPDDRVTAPVFADGAAAVLVGKGRAETGIGPVVWGSLGDKAAALEVRPPVLSAGPAEPRPAVRMDGLAITRWVYSTIPGVVEEILRTNGIDWGDVSAFVPHQANWLLIQRLVKLLEAPGHVVVADDVRVTGNTSSAAVPLALHRLVDSGAVRPGGWAVLVGFGAGLAYAGQAVRLPDHRPWHLGEDGS
ncbi:3-oxoacyl-[acyl-carrier-protein] synthase III C-terminal domain-containing protein [Kitasatospora sp. NPDC008115]|uniref:3-oxoacyl-[acyl-carrier-protein] synthase III C-terminal domain-containing protein n=1 Tax=Kitasatospora sp. NPDC008115 TaxID=3364022 RepID=UPI0036E9D414